MEKDEGGINIQDSYLGRARKERALLTVFLNNGKKIVGRIRSYDRYTVILEDHGAEQMIFKHAISTISVSRAFANSINFDRASKGPGTTERAPSGPPAGSAPPVPAAPATPAAGHAAAAPGATAAPAAGAAARPPAAGAGGRPEEGAAPADHPAPPPGKPPAAG
jgi:host factor-I protein